MISPLPPPPSTSCNFSYKPTLGTQKQIKQVQINASHSNSTTNEKYFFNNNRNSNNNMFSVYYSVGRG